MMRFTYLHWTRADYEALDGRLANAEVRTCRYILPDDVQVTPCSHCTLCIEGTR